MSSICWIPTGGCLTQDEFRALFSKADGKISEADFEQLFAFCDADGSGTVNAQELEDGWAFLCQRVVEREVAALGLSTTDIVFAVVSATLGVSLLFAFIFTAIAGWSSNNSFEAAVQTALVSMSGIFVKAVRKRAPAEDKDMDELVQEVSDSVDAEAD